MGPRLSTSKLRPDPHDGFAFATPFSVPGRGSKEVIAEFGDDRGWSPEPSGRHRIRLQARVHPSERWTEIVAFAWWAPPPGDAMSRYVTYANGATQPAATYPLTPRSSRCYTGRPRALAVPPVTIEVVFAHRI
jgi:hypothetical protein